jgi:hypothetical protein
MNCKHDFQIKQRITNRNSLLEYDIWNKQWEENRISNHMHVEEWVGDL